MSVPGKARLLDLGGTCKAMITNFPGCMEVSRQEGGGKREEAWDGEGGRRRAGREAESRAGRCFEVGSARRAGLGTVNNMGGGGQRK